MKKKILLATILIIIALLAILMMEFFRADVLLRIERKQIKTQAALLLDELMFLEFRRASDERYDQLEQEGFPKGREIWGGAQDDLTLTIYKLYPEVEKITRQFSSLEEWNRFSKENNYKYHYTGLNLERLDSTFTEALLAKEIVLPFCMMIKDTTETILKQTPQDVNFADYRLALDSIPLGITQTDYLYVAFDDSNIRNFKHLKTILFFSLGGLALICITLFYLLNTIALQRKIAVEKENATRSLIHDLKSPVAYFSVALPDLNGKEVSKEDYQILKKYTEQMEAITDKILLMSDADTIRLLNLKSTPLFPFLEAIVAQYRTNHPNRLFSMHCEDRSIETKIDMFHLERAMANLIENAIKYSGADTEIDISCYRKGKYVHIAVKDQGVGIPEDHLKHLFKKSYRVPKQETEHIKGFGLGLFYVEQIAKKHGGNISVQSRYKQGSEFIIKIPIK